MIRLAQSVMIVLTPLLLVLIAVRLVMTPVYLQIEYTRPGFPDDPYGFTRDERLRYGPRAVAFLINDEPLTFLGDLTFDDGTPLFNQRELVHMHDVQIVTRYAFLAAVVLSVLYVACGLWLASRKRAALAGAFQRGGIATLLLIVGIVVMALAAWDRFFVLFHELFFTDGTWYFPTSDTLIRLFPEQFWFDAAIAIGVLSALGAVAVWAAGVFIVRAVK
ncbi:MAG: TIGR01906 family membrane protein [Chloroflexi bacterium]|nr:TIGR01906 family membrane protein [Chloroflexota bacterium]